MTSKVSLMPPDWVSLRNFWLVNCAKCSGNIVIQPSGIRPPKISSPCIFDMMALSKPKTWRTSSFTWRLNASNVAVDMCRSVTISDRNFFVATSDILLLRTWLITKGSVVDSRCFMADIRTDYWPRLSFDSSPVIIESVKYQSKLIYYTNKRNHSKWLEFTKSAKMSSWIWFGIVIGCLTAERISKTTRKLFDSTSSLKRNSGMTSRVRSCTSGRP